MTIEQSHQKRWIHWSNCSDILKVLDCLIIRMGAVYVKLDVGVEILWKLIETMLNAVVCCLQGGSNHFFFHFENFEIFNFSMWRCQFDKLKCLTVVGFVGDFVTFNVSFGYWWKASSTVEVTFCWSNMMLDEKTK